MNVWILSPFYSDPENRKENTPLKILGDPPFRPVTQNVGAFAPDGAMEDLDTIEKLARGYIFTDKKKHQICAHNATVIILIHCVGLTLIRCVQVAIGAGANEAAQTWLLLESLLIDLVTPPTPPLSPLPLANPQLVHAASAPAVIPTVATLPQTPAPSHSHRSATVDPFVLAKHKDTSPGSLSKRSDDRYPRSTSGHRSPHGVTPTSSTNSSPRKSSTGLPVPGAIFARRESGAGLPPPLRPRLPSSFRRPSFSTQSMHSTHSESPSDSLRSHLSLRHVGEGALDDSDSSDSDSEHDVDGEDAPQHGDKDGEKDVGPRPPSSASSSRGPNSPYRHRSTTAHPSPLSRLAVTGQHTWTEDEKDDDDSPSPASTSAGSSGEEDTDDDHASATRSRRPSAVRMRRSNSNRSKTRSRSSTVASFVAPSPSQLRRVVKQESQSSIRTVTAGELTPAGTLSRADGALRRDDTVRDLSGGRAGSSLSLHQRARSEALSTDFMFDGESEEDGEMETPFSATRTQSDRTKAAVREAEGRLRQLAWDAMRERFEQYADEVRAVCSFFIKRC